MALRPDAALLRRQQDSLSRLVSRDLAGFWSTLDLSKPERARDRLLQYAPVLVATYGESAASIAADWYDEQRAAAGVRTRFRAVAAAPTKAELVEAQVRFAAGHLFTSDPEQTLAFLDGSAQKYALAPSRETVATSAIRDPAARGWSRITGASPCDFCSMLEGRGAVYTEASVDFEAHGHCNCSASPVWD